MKRFIKTIIAFLLPFGILSMIFIYVDPYDVIRKEQNKKLIELKAQISYKVDYLLYNLQKFHNNPTDIIILGDSRAARLGHSLFEQLTSKETTNLSPGGGTIPEIVETFWYANEIHDLKEVYIGINFNLYSELNNRNGILKANNTRKSLSSYLTSRSCIRSTYLILFSLVTNQKVEIEKPSLNRDEFWQDRLDWAGPRYYQAYKYSEKYYNDLLEISDYCNQNEIKLVYFMAPTHIDLQDKIRQYKREQEFQRFIDDFKTLNAPVYDFDFPNEITRYKRNFTDPFHFNDSVSGIVTRILIGDSLYAQEQSNIFKIVAD